VCGAIGGVVAAAYISRRSSGAKAGTAPAVQV
jgi:hypothetical protein